MINEKDDPFLMYLEGCRSHAGNVKVTETSTLIDCIIQTYKGLKEDNYDSGVGISIML